MKARTKKTKTVVKPLRITTAMHEDVKFLADRSHGLKNDSDIMREALMKGLEVLKAA